MKQRKINPSHFLIFLSIIFTIFSQNIIAQAQLSSKIQDIIFIDSTAPTTPVVIDDGEFTYSKTQLHASWSSQDPESGISEYQYAIGKGIGLTDVVGWTSAGTNTSVTHTGLTLVLGQIYYFSVQAKNKANLWSGVGYSDGITVLNNPPQIQSIQPQDNSTFTEGDVIVIQVQAQDPDADPLQYRFLVDGNLLQDWTFSNSYSWQTQTGDLKLKTITVDAQDGYGGAVFGTTHVFLFRKVPAPE